MRALKQNTAVNIMVFMVDSSDHVTGKEGLTLIISISKGGSVFVGIDPVVTDRGSGWYNIEFTSSHIDTLGDLAIHIIANGADDTDLISQVTSMLDNIEIIKKLTGNKATKAGSIITIYEEDEHTIWRQYELAGGGRLII